jgi:cold shock CspA family protein
MTEAAHGVTNRGEVAEFDAAVGLGVIEALTGERLVFHCIEIADGSRDISVGAPVSFDLLAKFGRYEAANLRT